MLGTLLVPGSAFASAKGRKNTAIGLGAVAVQQLLTGKTTNGVVLGAGAAYAYKRYQDAQREEKRRNRSAAVRTNSYRSRYGGSNVNRTTRTTTRSRYGGASTSPNGRLYSETKSTYVPNGSYYFTGHVINDATELTNRYITVDQNGVARKVLVPKSATVAQAGRTMSVHELQKGDLVRVLAVRGTDHWNASKIELLNAVDADAALENRDTFGDSYTRRGGTSTATTSSRYNGTGVVERVSDDGRSFDLRVGSNVRTVFVDSANFHGLSSGTDLREGDRVRVSGDLDGRDVTAADVTLVQ
jgi:hypothetical protein